MVSMFATNCYLLWEDDQVLIIDPGGKGKKIIEHIEQAGGKVVAVCCTHGHLDHIASIDQLCLHFHCPLWISEFDARMLQDPRLNLSQTFDGKPLTVQTKPHFYEKELCFGPFKGECVDTPGHTPGSVCLIFDDVMFSGDTLFKGSIGRTDFILGSNTQMMQSLRLLKKYSLDLKVYPGHGEATTLQEEFLSNPYLN